MYNQPYNYNPYMQQPYNRMQPQQVQQIPTVNENLAVQPVNNSYKLNGKQVESIDVARVMDTSMDGITNYFPISDGSAIVTKQLQMDGTSKMIIYKPVNDETKDVPKYVTMEDFKKEINKFDLSDLEEEIKDIKQEIKDLKKKKKGDD